MKGGQFELLASAMGLLLITIAQPAFGESALNQEQFGRALRPPLQAIPSVLQETRGLPTVGPVARPAPSARYSTVSTSPTAAIPVSRAARPSQRMEHASVATPAAPSGCQAGSGTCGFKVAFEFNSAQLKPEVFPTLRELGKALNAELKDQKLFEIDGHTDAVGSPEYNDRLSALRAAAVRDFLVNEMGVAPERLRAVGKGFREPINPHNPYGPENRRVVVVNQAS